MESGDRWLLIAASTGPSQSPNMFFDLFSEAELHKKLKTELDQTNLAFSLL
jgi:hypothetical protein